MLTPIKKQGDEHIYILLKIGIIDWMSGCYMGVCRFVRMLIGSEINRDFTLPPDFTLSPIFETVVSCDKNKKTPRRMCCGVFGGSRGSRTPDPLLVRQTL